MTARALALRVLVDVEAGGWSDRLLQSRETRLADRRDRGLLHVLVLTTLRWQRALDRAVEPHVKGKWARLDPVVRAALRAGAAEFLLLGRPGPIAVDEAVNALRAAGGARAAGFVNAVLRKVVAARPALDPAATVPDWLLARWSERFGDALPALLAAINAPAHPFAVARPGRRDEVARALAADGVETRPATYHPDGLAVLSGAPQQVGGFRAGDFVLLDEAAALVALLARPDDDRPVADLAAAPGGKATLLAWSARGPVVASDLEPTRTATLRDTLARRSDPGRVLVVRADGQAPPLAREAFGTVLLDAPCSGTGTLRRRPEKRLRLVPADVADCASSQEAMLDAAAGLVAPGGALVYAVCSLEPEEGTAQVERFLARHPRFLAEDPRPRLGAAAALVAGDPPLLRTVPGEADLDGFCAARLVRRP